VLAVVVFTIGRGFQRNVFDGQLIKTRPSLCN
jgi:hypothetical protein